MEFLLIGDSKLKIVLTDSDMKKYNIDAARSDCTDPLCRRAVWSILDKAKEAVKFDPAGDKVLVQFYPVKDAGCEVFVTKLGILSASSAKIISNSDRVDILSRESLLYAFDGLEYLTLAAKAIIKSGKLPSKSDAYLGEGDRYFLVVEEYGKSGQVSEFPCLLEFGKSLPKDFTVYILEHASLLVRSTAIEYFGK